MTAVLSAQLLVPVAENPAVHHAAEEGDGAEHVQQPLRHVQTGGALADVQQTERHSHGNIETNPPEDAPVGGHPLGALPRQTGGRPLSGDLTRVAQGYASDLDVQYEDRQVDGEIGAVDGEPDRGGHHLQVKAVRTLRKLAHVEERADGCGRGADSGHQPGRGQQQPPPSVRQQTEVAQAVDDGQMTLHAHAEQSGGLGQQEAGTSPEHGAAAGRRQLPVKMLGGVQQHRQHDGQVLNDGQVGHHLKHDPATQPPPSEVTPPPGRG